MESTTPLRFHMTHTNDVFNPLPQQDIVRLFDFLMSSMAGADGALKPLTKQDVADIFGISLRTVENWVSEGDLLAPKKIGNRVYWHRRNFYTWLNHRLEMDDKPDGTIKADAAQPELTGQRKRMPKKTVNSVTNEQNSLRARDKGKLTSLMN